MSTNGSNVVTEAEILQSIGEKLQASLNVSANRLRKMWHGFGRVLRQQLLEALGERWGGGYVAVAGLGTWYAKRKTPDGTPVLGFVVSPAVAEQHKLLQHPSKSGQAAAQQNATREFDVHRLSTLCHVDHEKVESFCKAFFARVGEVSASPMKVALPHVGRLDILNREVTFRFFSELLDIISPSTGMSLEAVPATHPNQPRCVGDSRVIESVQKWLTAHPSTPLETCSTISTSFTNTATAPSLRRASSTVVTGCPANTVRSINSRKLPLRPQSSAPAAPVLRRRASATVGRGAGSDAPPAPPPPPPPPHSHHLSSLDKAQASRAGGARDSLPHAGGAGSGSSVAKLSSVMYQNRAASADAAVGRRASSAFAGSVGGGGTRQQQQQQHRQQQQQQHHHHQQQQQQQQHPVESNGGETVNAAFTHAGGVSGTAAPLLPSNAAAPLLAEVNGSAHGRARVPRDALGNVMAEAYQRHEAFLQAQKAEEQRHQSYIKMKMKEADEYEKAATRSRRELIKKTSEALGLQVCEKRAGRQAPQGAAQQASPPGEASTEKCPVPQEPLKLARDGKVEQRTLCEDLNRQVQERRLEDRRRKRVEREADANALATAKDQLLRDSKAKLARKRDTVQNLTKSWQYQIALR